MTNQERIEFAFALLLGILLVVLFMIVECIGRLHG